MLDELTVLILVRDDERYCISYDRSSEAEALRGLGRWASNPELSFTWYDAAVLSRSIRQENRIAGFRTIRGDFLGKEISLEPSLSWDTCYSKFPHSNLLCYKLVA